jgi:hypothetical protein
MFLMRGIPSGGALSCGDPLDRSRSGNGERRLFAGFWSWREVPGLAEMPT